ncbi:conserved Plasmodium protein, unknown function [Plasmodium gallinaceum]|uniref:Protein AMR3 n=1 Tax=Plasmodium gallinaceum TaxID=5849 RepID=A0A1J1GYP6_PLAGA|nr:conserved Plasmodium protein, unknown function [Plasmodium gallinaceum]CRG97439.1 conserved Plasmodium protein, unknown function [Plasmodium gallinaceum]
MKFVLLLLDIILIFFIKILKNYERKYILVKCNKYYLKRSFNVKRNIKILNFLNLCNSRKFFKLYMTRKFKYKYRNTLEKRKRKGHIKNQINQKLKKKHSAYIVITEKLSKLDPDQKYFKYDKNILKEYENIKDIYKNRKLGRKFNQFNYWYSSNKKEAKINYSRHVNFAITNNKFNFKNVFSYFHILEIVHEKFKNNPFYINGLQAFINKYYDPVTQKRIKFYDKIKEQLEIKKKNGDINKEKDTKKNIYEKGNKSETEENLDNINITSETQKDDKINKKEDAENSNNNLDIIDENELKNDQIDDTNNFQNDEQLEKEGVTKSKSEFFELIKNNIGTLTYSHEVNDDSSFKLFGSSTSCILKKNAPLAYDIKNPFMKSKLSSKRRRFKERKLFDIINFKCKNRKERLMLNAVRKLSKRKMKNEKYVLDSLKVA